MCMCWPSARVAACPAGPAPAVDERFRRWMVFTIWMGNDNGKGAQYPEGDVGHYKRSVFIDDKYVGVLIRDKAFVGYRTHILRVNTVWDLVGVTENPPVVLHFASKNSEFSLEEDADCAKRLRELMRVRGSTY